MRATCSALSSYKASSQYNAFYCYVTFLHSFFDCLTSKGTYFLMLGEYNVCFMINILFLKYGIRQMKSPPSLHLTCLLFFFSVVDERRLRISKANHIQKASTITINTPVTSSQTFSSECHLLYARAFLGLNRALKRWVAYELYTVCKRFFGGIKILHCHTIRTYFQTWMSRFLLLRIKPGSVLGPLLGIPVLSDFLQILWLPSSTPLPFHLYTVYSAIYHLSICRLTAIYETMWISYWWKYVHVETDNTLCHTLRVLYWRKCVGVDTVGRLKSSLKRLTRMTYTLAYKPSLLYLYTYTQLNITP